MVDVVASVQSAIETLGRLRALAKKIEDAEFSMLLADLSGELADAKLEVADLKTKLAVATEKYEKLEKQISATTDDAPKLHEGVYQFDGVEGLFCTACFDSLGKKVRVNQMPGTFKDIARWRCPACKATYT